MRTLLSLVLVPALLAGHASRGATAGGNITVEVSGTGTDVLSSITPKMVVSALRLPDDPLVEGVGVRISTSAAPDAFVLVDTLVATADSAEIHLTTPLPSGATVFIRGFARLQGGSEVPAAAVLTRRVPNWVTLLHPNAAGGAILDQQQPEFRWSTPRVNSSLGPWTFDISVFPTAGGPVAFTARTSDTTFSIPVPLEFNTSYRWSLSATLAGHPRVTVFSRSSFVIVDQTVPRVTLLYQSFPNPFPSPLASFACIWFDLARGSTVALDVLDIRTNVVRRLYPPYGVPSLEFAPGKYGREVNSESGCTGEFKWDGLDDRGRAVIPGVYLLRLRADGREFVKSMVFRGL